MVIYLIEFHLSPFLHRVDFNYFLIYSPHLSLNIIQVAKLNSKILFLINFLLPLKVAPGEIKLKSPEINYFQNSTIGSPVFQVVSSDPDDPNTANGRLTYRLLDNGKFGRDTLAFSIGRL